MPSEGKESKNWLPVAGGISILLAIGLVTLIFILRTDVIKTRDEIGRLKDEYKLMKDMKGKIEDLKRKHKNPPPMNENEGDIQTFLSRKAEQAGIKEKLSYTPGPAGPKTGNWKERTYTISVSGTKESPLPRIPFVEFLRLVEEERPLIKSKSINVDFNGNNFGRVQITFSHFTPAP